MGVFCVDHISGLSSLFLIFFLIFLLMNMDGRAMNGSIWKRIIPGLSVYIYIYAHIYVGIYLYIRIYLVHESINCMVYLGM
ncbi:hypothetical protein M441DRAFT_316755 [Trichoderma asperellum CBS 433.97]|uniref:Uncharacterized protein n=1 Tax=Trichoderma asperellum (strain ATCC 204424 / CBS 433.97 / NBRC 101777) TaxID=1042311 RepID=A0A2T3ZKS8_TRIA4|nr:hypothetical protein M441DRAFT_316755 [Trichoderma asperellum CBS 433.97]PTB45410.1 hypothetical protein M441DRAFT_316755 [Trichoderma asperellum CBS 433.97]